MSSFDGLRDTGGPLNDLFMEFLISRSDGADEPHDNWDDDPYDPGADYSGGGDD